jgi:hypothetical protein
MFTLSSIWGWLEESLTESSDSSSQESDICEFLQPDVDPGNIRVSLSYKRETMILNVLVMEACNLLLPMSAAKNKRPTGNCYLRFSDVKH